jgi:hypothetical protein
MLFRLQAKGIIIWAHVALKELLFEKFPLTFSDSQEFFTSKPYIIEFLIGQFIKGGNLMNRDILTVPNKSTGKVFGFSED